MHTLDNGILKVDLTSMENNPSTRFEHLCYVSQISLAGHTFLSSEMTKAGPGTGGAGLMHGWLSDSDTDENIIGVGKIDLGGEKYSIRRNYDCDFLKCSILQTEDTELESATEARGRYRLKRKYSISASTLRIETTLCNDDSSRLSASEYCHNFLMFDDQQIGPAYRVEFSNAKDLAVVRGSILLDDKGYSPICFEPTLGTIALSYGKDGMERVIISNRETGTSVEITTSFIPEKCYHWISPWSICPEAYLRIDLSPGSTLGFVREYTFS